MTSDTAYETILRKGDHLHRMPRRPRTTLGRRDYIRARLLLMVATEAIDRAEHEGPDE